MNKHRLIFAGNENEARKYLKTHDIIAAGAVIVRGKEQVIGINPRLYRAVFIGGWEDNADVKAAVDEWTSILKKTYKNETITHKNWL